MGTAKEGLEFQRGEKCKGLCIVFPPGFVYILVTKDFLMPSLKEEGFSFGRDQPFSWTPPESSLFVTLKYLMQQR